MSSTDPASSAFRSRLIAVVTSERSPEALEAALTGGDMATVILAGGREADQGRISEAVAACHAHDVAALVADNVAAMELGDADGLLLVQPENDFRDYVARFSPHKIVGFGGMFSRHRAMELGEAVPDFLMFGRPDGDIRAEAHPKSLALGAWWSDVFEIPCVVMAGSSLESVAECVATGCEFVAMGRALFEHGGGPAEAVALANEALDRNAVPADD